MWWYRPGGAALPGRVGRALHGPTHPAPDSPHHLQREPARLHQAQDQTQEETQVRVVIGCLVTWNI